MADVWDNEHTYVCTHTHDDIVEATSLRCDNWRIVLDEHVCSKINQSIATDCRTFQPLRPTYVVLYTVDKGLRGRNVLQSVAIEWLIDSASLPYVRTQHCCISSMIATYVHMFGTVSYRAVWALTLRPVLVVFRPPTASSPWGAWPLSRSSPLSMRGTTRCPS